MSTLLPAPQMLDLVALHADMRQIALVARSCATCASCPLCGQVSPRIHSRYHRQLLDLPCMGVSVRLDVTVRRLFCDTSSCMRKIFTERLPEVVAPSARRTLRLTTWLSAIGLALGGAAGSRLLCALGMLQSRSTLLRQVNALSLDAPSVGPAIGIDEFAFRRGRRFGTIIVDLATRRVVELLPTVEAEKVIAWLRAHPQIQVVSRDRAYNFGEPIRQGAPQALQVADRWHLLKNLGEHLEAALRNRKAALRTPRGELLESCGVTLGRTKDQEARGRDEYERQVALFEHVKEAQARGLNPSAIAKLLDIARPTAYKYARMTAPPDRWRLPSGVLKPLAAYVPYIYQRWNEGCRNATRVYRELRAKGRPVSRRTVTRYMAILRTEGGHGRSFAPVEPAAIYTPPAPPPPSLTPRQAAILFSRDPQQLTERQQSANRAPCAACWRRTRRSRQSTSRSRPSVSSCGLTTSAAWMPGSSRTSAATAPSCAPTCSACVRTSRPCERG